MALEEAQSHLTSEMFASVVEAQKEFAAKAVETRHINPISLLCLYLFPSFIVFVFCFHFFCVCDESFSLRRY